MTRLLDDTRRTRETPALSLEALPEFARILDALREGKSPLHVHKLAGASKALLAADLRRLTGRSILYVAPGEEGADAVRADLELFLGEPVHLIPEHTTRPYDPRPPHTEVSAARLEALTHLAFRGDAVLVTTAKGLAEKVVSPEILRRAAIRFRKGDPADLEDVLGRLTYLGYARAQAVEEVGDYALRGGILDVYSLGGEHPIRIEVEYDEIASIREFDVRTQRSRTELEEAVVIPRYEILLDQERIDRVVKDLGATDPSFAREMEEAFEADIHPSGIERMAGRLLQDLGPLTRYLPEDAIVLIEEPSFVRSLLEDVWDLAAEAQQTLVSDFRHVSPPGQLFLSPDAFEAALAPFFALRLSDLAPNPGGDIEAVRVQSSPPETFGRQLEMWRKYLGDILSRGLRVVIFCDNDGQRKRLDALLLEEGLSVELPVGVLSGGFMLEAAGLLVLTDHEFFGRPRRRTRARRFRSGFGLKELRSLKPGAFIVHVEHGIGRYLGLGRIEVNGHMTDVLQLAYHGNDKLYVPVDQLDLIQKYSSEDGGRAPALSRIGGTAWAKTKDKAKRAIREMAGELIRLYALRKAHSGHAFGPDTPWQRELEGSFPFEETPDQVTTMEAVRKDMESPSPMDRLVCGDVGYGKTEIAVRAAFKAVMDGKQVAMLVPTTILCEQHYDTFRERYAGFPVRIDMLSRFRSAKEREETLRKVASGEIDMVVGTHALLGKSVRFKDLGLLVVDEEQRFGVAHKERIKQLRANVDVLTLTATPIPRTLNMSLLGVRDITVIQTPPRGRMPVETQIAEFDRELIQEMLLREADRGGQSFFVHNRVESIHTMATYIRKLCPQLRVGVGHGQLPEHDLERVMHEFTHQEIDVLVATMIIENGLDIPTVNTMVVNRADAFGLSQLYQLRGRVGRSNQKAFCTFLVAASKALTETAMKRLRAIAEFDELGSGFALAMRDLEIRGAGNILGSEQHGHLVAVGFEMYCRLVDEAVRELKGLPLEDRPEPRLMTDVDAFLPDEYVEDAEEKVAFYKRLAEADSPERVASLREEIQDRFGRPNPAAEAMFGLRTLRLLGARVPLASITLRRGTVDLELLAPPSPDRLRAWMQRIRLPVEFATSGRFAMKAKGGLPEALLLAEAMATGAENPEGTSNS